MRAFTLTEEKEEEEDAGLMRDGDGGSGGRRAVGEEAVTIETGESVGRCSN